MENERETMKQRDATKADHKGRIIERLNRVGEKEYYTYYSPLLTKHETAEQEAEYLNKTFPEYEYRAILK